MPAHSSFEMQRKRLSELPPGHVQEVDKVDEVAALLAGCWQFFSGARAERIHAGKLQRMEDLQWDPPVLSFTIERHGGMGMGSTRAELRSWRLDLNRRIALCELSRSYRQVLQPAEGLSALGGGLGTQRRGIYLGHRLIGDCNQL